MKDSPESKYGDVTGFKPIALSLLGGIVSFCIIDFFIHSGDFRKTLIPNPFQKNINKSIYVVESADSTGGGVNYGDEALLRRCLKEPQTISSQKLQELFSLGVKTISAQPWKNDRYYGSLFLNGVCGGQFYVLDGPENLLNNL